MSVESNRPYRPDGITAIALYFFMSALLFLVGACAILFVGMGLGVTIGSDRVAMAWSLIGLGLGFIVVFLGALISVAVGWGLWGMHNWARWGAIALSVLMLSGFPIFTLIGAVIIIYLLRADIRPLFERGAVG